MMALARFLRDLFEPVGRALGLSWPVVEKILLVLAALGVALLLWQIGLALRARIVAMRRAPAAAPEWSRTPPPPAPCWRRPTLLPKRAV
jgi:hypothetical protein